MTHEPKHYNLPDHLAKIFRSPEYADAAKKVGKTVEAFQDEVTKALKQIVEENRRAELAAFESEAGKRALEAATK